MNITLQKILYYLEQVVMPYRFMGKENSDYTIASVFHPVDSGFYFFVGDNFNLSIKNGLILSNKEVNVGSSNGLLLVEAAPQQVFYQILDYYFRKKSNGIISTLSEIHPEAILGKNVQIDPFTVLGKCEIGDNCIIGSHSIINDNTKIAPDVFVDSHSIIGAQGVAWVWNEQQTERIHQPQLGGVKIEEKTFLGANTIVVRGSLNEYTCIGKNTLLAPSSRIGHGTQIGNYVHFANNIATGGNTIIGDYSFVGSGCVFRPRVKIHAHTIVGAGAVVVKNTSKEGQTLMGVPAKEYETKAKPAGMPKPKQINN